MADDNLYSLLIRVEGGDASAAEIIKSKYAIKSVGDESDALKSRFQEGFQHLALKGFIADAAQGIGLGGELRPVISLLNAGITGLGESLGIAAGGIPLLLTGLTALGGLAFVAYEHFHKNNEELEKMAEKQRTAAETTGALKEKLEALEKTAEGLPASLRSVKGAVDDLNASQRESLRVTEQQELAVRRKAIASMQEQIDTARAYAAELQREQSQMSEAQKQYSGLGAQIDFVQKKIDEMLKSQRSMSDQNAITTADIVAQGKGYKDAADQAEKLGKAREESSKKSEKAEDEAQRAFNRRIDDQLKGEAFVGAAYDEVQKAQEGLIERTKILANEESAATANAWQKKDAEIKKFQDEHLKYINETYDKAVEKAREAGLSIVQLERDKTQAIDQLGRTVSQRQVQNYTEVQTALVSAAENARAAFANAMASSILEAKNAHDRILALQKNFEEAAVASLIKIATEAVITKSAVAAIFA